MTPHKQPMIPFDGEFMLVPIEKIEIDHGYQRARKRLVEKIAKEFDWGKFGALQGSVRDNGKVYLYDGQQRYLAALERDAKKVPVIVFQRSRTEEAGDFVDIQVNRIAVNPYERWRARLLEGDAVVTLLNQIVEENDLTVGNSTGGGLERSRTVTSIAAIERIYNQHGEWGLRNTLALVREAWPTDRMGISALVLASLADFLHSKGAPSGEEIRQLLSTTTPGEMLRRAEALRFDMGGSKAKNLARAWDELYRNWKRRSKRQAVGAAAS